MPTNGTDTKRNGGVSYNAGTTAGIAVGAAAGAALIILGAACGAAACNKSNKYVVEHYNDVQAGTIYYANFVDDGKGGEKVKIFNKANDYPVVLNDDDPDIFNGRTVEQNLSFAKENMLSKTKPSLIEIEGATSDIAATKIHDYPESLDLTIEDNSNKLYFFINDKKLFISNSEEKIKEKFAPSVSPQPLEAGRVSPVIFVEVEV